MREREREREHGAQNFSFHFLHHGTFFILLYDRGLYRYRRAISDEIKFSTLTLFLSLSLVTPSHPGACPCRTGRNFQYYPAGTRLTATDCSSAMVDVCRAKADKEYPPATLSSKNQKDDDAEVLHAVRNKSSRGKFAKLDVRVDDAGNMGFKSGTFDTVVDTFGLCSYEDPVAVLREMRRVCRGGSKKKKEKNKMASFFGKNKLVGATREDNLNADDDDDDDDGGRLLLLEHGRSETHGWLSNILDKFAQPHAAKWGCYWNRDILKIVRDAGLEIVEVRTYHFGTTYYIICR